MPLNPLIPPFPLSPLQHLCNISPCLHWCFNLLSSDPHHLTAIIYWWVGLIQDCPTPTHQRSNHVDPKLNKVHWFSTTSRIKCKIPLHSALPELGITFLLHSFTPYSSWIWWHCLPCYSRKISWPQEISLASLHSQYAPSPPLCLLVTFKSQLKSLFLQEAFLNHSSFQGLPSFNYILFILPIACLKVICLLFLPLFFELFEGRDCCLPFFFIPITKYGICHKAAI